MFILDCISASGISVTCAFTDEIPPIKKMTTVCPKTLGQDHHVGACLYKITQ